MTIIRCVLVFFNIKMLLALIISSALLLGPVTRVNAENPANDDTGSVRQDRQYWPSVGSNSMIYRQPWLSSYFSKYFPSLPYAYPTLSSLFSGNPYNVPETRNPERQEPWVEDELFDAADEQVQSRQSVSLNNYFANRPYINNPNRPTWLSLNDGCTDPNGLGGICLSGVACRVNGGRPSGACTRGLGPVCCVNTVNTCGGVATLNNTYWQSPNTVSTGTSCALAVNIGNNIPNLKRPICRIRLDFITFTLEQPNIQTVCNVDEFTVTGASVTVPTLCGTNSGQHMYLTPFQPNGNLAMSIRIGSTTTLARSWNIKIAFLPCGANYLPPNNCLQYFTSGAGQVKSFNYDDVITAATLTRQLANQDYTICFRRELISDSAATRMCFTPCRFTSNPGSSFSLTLDSSAGGVGVANFDAGTCKTDYLIIPNSFDPAKFGINRIFQDRYCGTALSPIAGASTTVCTEVRDFSITYRTDATEAVTEKGNLGFCLAYEGRTG